MTRTAPIGAVVAGIVVGLAVGVLTAYAQGWLSFGVSSLSNSAGPWSLAAFAVARLGRRPIVAMASAIATLACCELGYAIATEIRGGSNATSTIAFWLTAALLAGPPLGLAAAWTRRDDWRRPAGWAVPAGVLIGEATYGWTTVADTTDWKYWAAELVVGLALAAIVIADAARRRLTHAVVAAGAASATALVVFAAARLA